MSSTNHFDVLIVGAGLSGIGAAYHLQKDCPNKTYAILESRQAIGGTWDLFRYPGIRSDSDMYTLGYNFKPWMGEKSITDGPSIKTYINETAREFNIDKHIQFSKRVISANWSTEKALWFVEVKDIGTDMTTTYSCNFLQMCSGYYNYDKGYTPDFEGIKKFKGQIIHPQHWPENLDYTGKKIIVIGSGATAVTLVPSLAGKAAHVTMLQRSPTYMANVPEKDPTVEKLRNFLPEKAVYRIIRTRNVALQAGFYMYAKARPESARKLLLGLAKRQLGPNYDMTHFTPSYKPWDERLCALPNGDMFKLLRKGDNADVVTDHIETFTSKGIKLKSGKELEADIIITATGLNLQLFGGMQISLDNKPFDMSQAMNYKGVMFENVPNLGLTFGYTNASWTLKADITSEYVCRLLNHLDRIGMRQCTPVNTNPSIKAVSFLDFNAGYVKRVIDQLPKAGTKAPWKMTQRYILDLVILRHKPVNDGVMVFSNPKRV